MDKSMESRFDEKFYALLNLREHLTKHGGESLSKEILAFIKAELKANDKKWRDRIKRVIKMNTWTLGSSICECGKEISVDEGYIRKSEVSELVDNLLKEKE